MTLRQLRKLLQRSLQLKTKVSETDFSISAIPHTVKITVLGERKEGDIVNLETDIIGKYVEKLITPVKEQPTKSNITRDFLNKYGF